MLYPVWLPDKISVNGDWNYILDCLYNVYSRDFLIDQLKLNSVSIVVDRTLEDFAGDKYERGFLHLITRIDHAVNQRLFDPRRAELLPWCNPIIKNAADGSVKCWLYKEGDGKVQIYLWLEEFDYVIILRKQYRKKGDEKIDVLLLVTAYYVDSNYTKGKLETKFNKRIDK